MKVQLVLAPMTMARYEEETVYQHAGEDILAKIAGICADGSECSEKTLLHCLKSGHKEIFEHLKYTFYIEGLSRDGLQELARHDVGVSLTVRGTRFNNDHSNYEITIPDEIQHDTQVLAEWHNLLAQSKRVYRMTKQKYGIDVAKGALLGAAHCRLFVSFDLLALMHFLNQRMCNRAHFDIRNLAHRIYELMAPELPIVIGQFSGPPCKTLGCKESRPCGKISLDPITRRAKVT